MSMTISDATDLNTLLYWATGTARRMGDPVTDADATAAARRLAAKAYKALGAGHKPDEVTLGGRTAVDVSDVDGVLAGFEPRQSSDFVKSDLELTCTGCGAVLCDVESGDPMDTLVRMCLDHEHEPGDDEPAPRPYLGKIGGF